MLLAGALVLSIFMTIYVLLTWIILRVYLIIDKRTAGAEEKKTNMNSISRENLKSWVKLFSYCFLLPFLIYQLILAGCIMFFSFLDMPYAFVYVKDFGMLLAYAWIFSLILYSMRNLDTSQKYKLNILVLASFLGSYLIGQWLVTQGVEAVMAYIVKII